MPDDVKCNAKRRPGEWDRPNFGGTGPAECCVDTMGDHAPRIWDLSTGREKPYCVEHGCDEYTGYSCDDIATIEGDVRLCLQRGSTHYMTCGCTVRTAGPVEWNESHPAYRFWGPTVLLGVETSINPDGEAFIE